MGEISSLQELLDRENIRDRLYQYCAGCDRADEALIRSAYWDDIDTEQLTFRGDLEAFLPWCFAGVRSMDIIAHYICNVQIDLQGDKADVQSSFISYNRTGEAGAMVGALGGGRYIDKFEKRGGIWKIAKRRIVIDINQPVGPSGPTLPAGEAKRWPEDIIYSWFKS